METLSSNSFSVDTQLDDVLTYLENNDGIAFSHLVNMFPEITSRVYEEGRGSSWFDTTVMGVDSDWSCWVIDEIEAQTHVMWWEGEPFLFDDEDYQLDPDDIDETWFRDAS